MHNSCRWASRAPAVAAAAACARQISSLQAVWPRLTLAPRCPSASSLLTNPTSVPQAIVLSGVFIPILLVDKRKLTPARPLPALCGASVGSYPARGYTGHYIVICGLDAVTQVRLKSFELSVSNQCCTAVSLSMSLSSTRFSQPRSTPSATPQPPQAAQP